MEVAIKLSAFTRDIRSMLASPSGGWLVLLSLGIGLSMLWTTVPLFLGPLGYGLGGRLFPSGAATIAFFGASALVMGCRALVKGSGGALFAFGLPHALAGVLGSAALVAAGFSGNDDLAWVVLRCAGAVLCAFSSCCAVLSASLLLKRLSPAKATIACIGSFLVVCLLTIAAAFLDGPVACAIFSSRRWPSGSCRGSVTGASRSETCRRAASAT